MGLPNIFFLSALLMVALMVESLGNDKVTEPMLMLGCHHWLPREYCQDISQRFTGVCKWPCHLYARRSSESPFSKYVLEPSSRTEGGVEAPSRSQRQKVYPLSSLSSLQRKIKKKKKAGSLEAVKSWQECSSLWGLHRLHDRVSHKGSLVIASGFLVCLCIPYIIFFFMFSLYRVKKLHNADKDLAQAFDHNDKCDLKTFRRTPKFAELETHIYSTQNFHNSKKDYFSLLDQPVHGKVLNIPRETEPVIVYTLTSNLASVRRLASYNSLPDRSLIQSSISFSTLVDAGFKYIGRGTSVVCDDCTSTHDIHTVSQNPFAQSFHLVGCQFLKAEGFSEGSTEELDNENADSGFSEGSDIDGEGNELHQQSSNRVPSGNGTHSGKSSMSVTTLQPQPTEPCRNADNTAKSNTDATVQRTSGTRSSTNDGRNSNSNNNFAASGHVNSSSNTTTNSTKAHNNLQTTTLNSSNSVAGGSASHNGASASHNGASATSDESDSASNMSDSSTATNASDESSAIYTDGNAYVKDSDLKDRTFYGSELYVSEHAIERQKPFRVEGVKRENCEKNPGHFSYYSLAEAQLDRLPEFARCAVFLELLHLLSDLTVRIVVSYKSSARDSYQGASVELEKYRTGTGSVIREPLFDVEDQETKNGKISSVGSKHWKLKSFSGAMRNRCKSLLSKHKPAANTVFVETNRHIVFDDKEAEHTSVEFYFNHVSRRGVVQIKGSRILHDSSVEGGERSFLVCHVPDKSLIETLRVKRERLEDLVKDLPSKVREELHKRVLILHHPHGGEKVYSFGEYVVNRYILKRGASASSSSQTKLEKLKGYKQNPSDLKNLRKILFYVAETCSGSSGAPVIMFKPTGTDSEGGPTVTLSLWMHSGKERQGALNVSALEGCTEKDLAPPPKLYTPKPEPKPLPPPGPIVRMGNPYYPAYTLPQKRLESFDKAPGPFIHTPQELARGGFFWAGYDDCVRCYYCGVGLRNWKQGDDIYVEHERVRPDCHFLILQQRVIGATPVSEAAAAVSAAFGTSVTSSGASTTGNSDNISSNTELRNLSPGELEYSRQLRLRLHLAQTENALLQRPFICKVCNDKPVQPLYLPCGHLDSCEECTARLSHCPTCRTKILATVKVFFA